MKRGIRLRYGTYIKLYNTLVAGKDKSLTAASAETEASFTDGRSVVEYLHATKAFVYENGGNPALKTKSGNAINHNITFNDGYIGTIDGGADLSSDSFFTKAQYKGAVQSSDNWTVGWVRN